MSEVTLTIIDARRAIHGTAYGSIADAVVAALSAEPETIEELEAAVARFIKPTGEARLFNSFPIGVYEEPWDAGIVLVDLAARLVAVESTYSHPSPEGQVQYHNGAATDVWVNYRVPDDWLFIYSVAEWQAVSERRRVERAAMPPLEARQVLYGKVTEFIVRECISARAAGIEDPIAEIHARWLMTPRDDLRSQSPREALLAKRDFIDQDLWWREQRWSFVGECPPGLSPESSAWRFGGFGTHENVLYYYLVRRLLADCWQRVSEEKKVKVEAEVARLERRKEDWLSTPQSDLSGMNPFYVIERERERLPMALPAGADIIDEDCAFCAWAGEQDGPVFWHLDGSSLDDDFAFSFYRTREEWEEERRRWEEFNREWEQRHDSADGEDSQMVN